jgi:hypothetical protein
MNAPAQTYEQFLEAMVEEIRVPDSMYESAERSYRSFGDWVHRPESELLRFDPEIYSQGSFRLGTAIKPITNAEESDVDSVCELRKLDKETMTQSDLKKMVGREVYKYHAAKGMTEPVHEGNRCWRLDYAEGARFHMDILPAVPNATEQIAIMSAHFRDPTWANTAIAITDKRHPNYNVMSSLWQRSNPKGYSEWFASRQIFSAYRRKAKIIENQRALGIATMSVEDLPEYRARTPLQSAIMVLKRHRDNMFARNPDIKPISIIITTLAGHSYENEDTISEALQVILAKMDRFIHRNGRKYIIENPADPFENFADKWEHEPEKAAAFFEWLEQARADFGTAARAASVADMAGSLQNRMGVATAARAMDRVTGSGRLLRPAAAASAGAASMPSFANAERKPSAPRTFG